MDIHVRLRATGVGPIDPRKISLCYAFCSENGCFWPNSVGIFQDVNKGRRSSATEIYYVSRPDVDQNTKNISVITRRDTMLEIDLPSSRYLPIFNPSPQLPRGFARQPARLPRETRDFFREERLFLRRYRIIVKTGKDIQPFLAIFA
jgi:hypothetical protein